MMKNVIYFLIFLVFASCSSKKNVVYLQDIKDSNIYNTQFSEYKIKVDDILKIDFRAINQESVSFLGYSENLSNNAETVKLDGYQVDNKGKIYLPQVGELKVEGLTLIQARSIISEKIKEYGLLTDPVIDLKIINSHFTILGEVNKPGKYEFLKNNLHILEAIGMAGDLTINGVRNDIKVITNSGGLDYKTYSVDLTSKNAINNNFQIFSGDIIIVNPNSSKVKSAGVIGNTGNLLSLLSFILTSIIVITNN